LIGETIKVSLLSLYKKGLFMKNIYYFDRAIILAKTKEEASRIYNSIMGIPRREGKTKCSY
jgi:hypothetical protein